MVEDLDKTQTPNEANAQNADVEMRNENAEEGRQHGQNAEKTTIEPEEAQEKLTEGNGQSQQNQDEQMEVDQVCVGFFVGILKRSRLNYFLEKNRVLNFNEISNFQESLDVTLQIPQPAAEKEKDQNEAGNEQEQGQAETEKEQLQQVAYLER